MVVWIGGLELGAGPGFLIPKKVFVFVIFLMQFYH